MQEVVSVYNCTPHSSTGYTPYFLFFEHEARLPIDNLFSYQPSRTTNTDEWVELHHQRIIYAIKCTNNKLNKKAAERKKRLDINAKQSDLTTVRLRNRVSGRNKIQDVWSMIPHKIVGQVTGNNSAYLVQRLSDIKSKIVNHMNMLELYSVSQSKHDKTEALSNDVSSSSDDEVLMMSQVSNDGSANIDQLFQ